MFDKRKRGYNKAKGYIEEQAEKLQNREIDSNEVKTLFALGVEEILTYLPLDLLDRDVGDRDSWISKETEHAYEKILNEVELSLAFKVEAESFYAKTKLGKDKEREFLKDFAVHKYICEVIEKDLSDLLISELVCFVRSTYFTNSHLLFNRYKDLFQTFGGFWILELEDVYHSFRLHHFPSWQKVVDGYETQDEIGFLKLPTRIREVKMAAKLDEYKSIKKYLDSVK